MNKTPGQALDCREALYRIMVNAYRNRYRRQQRSPEVQASPGMQECDSNIIEAAISPVPDKSIEIPDLAPSGKLRSLLVWPSCSGIDIG